MMGMAGFGIIDKTKNAINQRYNATNPLNIWKIRWYHWKSLIL